MFNHWINQQYKLSDNNCSLCNRKSRLSIMSKDNLCMVCECDFNEEGEEEMGENEGMEKCGNCGKWVEEEEIAEFNGWCWECYNKECDREFNEQKHPDDPTKH